MAKMLVDKGADLHYFNATLFSNFKQSPEWQKLITEMPELVKQRYEHIDTALVKRIDDFMYRSEVLNKTEFKDKDELLYMVRLRHHDDSLNERLYTLMEENDYLNEEVIGAFRDWVLSSLPLYSGLTAYQFQKYPAATRLAIANAVKRGKLRAATGIIWLVEHSERPRLRYSDKYMVIDDTLWVWDNLNMVRAKPETVELLTDDEESTRFIR